MSYDFQQNQGGARPGFTEAPGGFGAAVPAPQQGGYQQQPAAPQPAYQQPAQQYQAPQPAPTAPAYDQYRQAPSTGNPPANAQYNANSAPAPSQGSGYNSGGGSSGSGYGGGNGAGGGGWKGNNNSGGGGWKGNGGGGGGGGGGWKGGGGGSGRGAFNRPQLTPEQLANMKLPKTAVIDGNLRAPEQLAPVIREMGELLQQHGFAIRTSGMDGVSKIVTSQLRGCELHIPWKGFSDIQESTSNFNTDEVKEFSKRYLPEWDNLKDSHRAFFCKNARLVLGKRLDQPCQIAIIWSEDGVEGPSTRSQQSVHAGHIAAICKAMHIPVINISNPDAVQRLRRFLEG